MPEPPMPEVPERIKEKILKIIELDKKVAKLREEVSIFANSIMKYANRNMGRPPKYGKSLKKIIADILDESPNESLSTTDIHDHLLGLGFEVKKQCLRSELGKMSRGEKAEGKMIDRVSPGVYRSLGSS